MSKLRETTIGKFMDDLSSVHPVPGGGSVAALSAAFAAALGLMVCEIGAKKGRSESSALADRLLRLRERFLELAHQDATAFSEVMAAYRIPKGAPGRKEKIEKALAGAARVPLTVGEECVELLKILGELVPLATRQSVSDVGVAANLGEAALESALLNVTINLMYMKDPAAKAPLAERRDALSAEGARLAAGTKQALSDRLS